MSRDDDTLWVRELTPEKMYEKSRCRYCEKEKDCLMLSTIRGCFGKVMGDKWGRSGFTVNKKNWVHAAGIVRTQDGEYRIKISDIMSPPISYCPKCGRKL